MADQKLTFYHLDIGVPVQRVDPKQGSPMGVPGIVSDFVDGYLKVLYVDGEVRHYGFEHMHLIRPIPSPESIQLERAITLLKKVCVWQDTEVTDIYAAYGEWVAIRAEIDGFLLEAKGGEDV